MLDNTFDKVKYSKSDFPDANIWMELLRAEVEGNVMNGSNMGSLEKLIERRIKELARPMLRYGAQLIADNQKMVCPVCESQLQVVEHKREHTAKSVFGDIIVDGVQGVYLLDCEKLTALKFPSFWFEDTPQGKFVLNIAFSQTALFNIFPFYSYSPM